VSAFGSVFSNLATTGFPGVFFDVYTGLLGLIFLVALFVYLRRRPLSRGVTPRRHLLRNVSQSVMWIAGVALFFCLMRYIELTYVDMRFYSYLAILLAICYCGYLTFFMSERYPVQRYQFDQLESGKRYRTQSSRRQPAAAAATPGRSPIQRGKRRR